MGRPPPPPRLVPPRLGAGRSASHRDDRPRTSRHRHQALREPAPHRNVNAPSQHDPLPPILLGDRAQKDGRKARPHDKDTSVRPRRAARPLSRQTLSYEIDGDTADLVRQCPSRRRRPPPRAPTDTTQRATRPSGRHRQTGRARPASTAEPQDTTHHQPRITHLGRPRIAALNSHSTRTPSLVAHGRKAPS